MPSLKVVDDLGPDELLDEDAENCYEAFELLGLIDAEFRSDPMSTQCFDRRIVERVRRCVEKNGKIGERLGRP